ncbi:MAG: substrate-binding domain-containing protein [Bacteroidales bacterium]|jgi:ribose transport system substrate-binding protein|nr:substrate-binding domain-containing protein [Bacteroidales bacterium]
MKGKSLMLSLVMVVSIVFFACQKTSNADKKVIYMIGMENQYDVWLAMKGAGIARGAESGYEVIYQAAPGGEADVQGQVALVETAIEAKPAAIVLSANDRAGLTDVCGKVKAANIPLVLFIAGIVNNDYDAFVAFDNYLAGRDVAKVICDGLGGRGKIGFIGAVTGSQTLSDREAGYRDIIAEEYPNIEFVGEALYSNNDVQRAMNATYDLLLAQPEIQAIFTVNTPTEEGICTALIELGRQNILVGGFDPSAAVIDYIEQGVMNALSCFDAIRLGRTAVDVAIQLAEGKTNIEGLDENRFFNVAPEVVTPQNYMTEHSQSLLYPHGK